MVILKGSGLRPYDSGEVKAYAVPKRDSLEVFFGKFMLRIEYLGFLRQEHPVDRFQLWEGMASEFPFLNENDLSVLFT